MKKMSSFCQGCLDFEKAIGGENQMAHLGGCIPFDDIPEVPEMKRRKTDTDELEKKKYQLIHFKEEIINIEKRINDITKIQENYIEKIKQLEELEEKIKELSLKADRIEAEMSEIEKEQSL